MLHWFVLCVINFTFPVMLHWFILSVLNFTIK